MGPWKTLPAHAADAQVFAIGDVHGQADTLAATLDAIASVPRSHLVRRLIFLGDLIDRGPQSLTAISYLSSAKNWALNLSRYTDMSTQTASYGTMENGCSAVSKGLNT